MIMVRAALPLGQSGQNGHARYRRGGSAVCALPATATTEL
jgi:hypothetical protein